MAANGQGPPRDRLVFPERPEPCGQVLAMGKETRLAARKRQFTPIAERMAVETLFPV